MDIYEEAKFEYNGYECRVLFMDTGHRCGYIKIPKDHPLCVDDYDYINDYDKLFLGDSSLSNSSILNYEYQ